jgi:hypothetical protein
MKYALLLTLLLPTFAFAQGRRAARPQASYRPTFTYDIGASTGSYNGKSYSEINLGLSWYVMDFLNWRNSLFSRFGDGLTSVSGLDSSARFFMDLSSDERTFGLHLFAGPGLRISNAQNTGVFGEAGAYFRIAGLTLGVGVKSLQYTNPGTNADGTDRPKGDSTVFVVLGGGGAL